MDYVILYLGAYSTKPIYPYVVHNNMIDLLTEELAPSLTSIYVTMERLQGNELITVKDEISGGRVQKTIQTTPKGFDAMDIMRKEIVSIDFTLDNLNDKFEVKK